MLCRAFLLATVAAAMAGSALAASDNHQWQTSAGAVVCRDYFRMSDALASRNDPRWFAETGCSRVAGGIPLTVVDPHPGQAVMRVRFHTAVPETVWINALGVNGYATVHGTRRGPLQYDDALRAQAKAETAAIMKELNK